MYNKTRNRGLAFVTMASHEQAVAALNALDSSVSFSIQQLIFIHLLAHSNAYRPILRKLFKLLCWLKVLEGLIFEVMVCLEVVLF